MRAVYFSASILITFAIVSCNKKDTPVSSSGNLISNESFELSDGTGTVDGWDAHNYTFASDVPPGGGSVSLMLTPGIDPDEAYADYTVSNLSGSHSFTLTCYVKCGGFRTGSMTLDLVGSDGSVSQLGYQSSYDSTWVKLTISSTATLGSGDKLKIHLSAGYVDMADPSLYADFDLVKLSD